MAHVGHEIIECSCGKVLLQCRCMSPDKKVIVRERACDDCARGNTGGGGTGIKVQAAGKL